MRAGNVDAGDVAQLRAKELGRLPGNEAIVQRTQITGGYADPRQRCAYVGGVNEIDASAPGGDIELAVDGLDQLDELGFRSEAGRRKTNTETVGAQPLHERTGHEPR